jgi:hypothetical protein
MANSDFSMTVDKRDYTNIMNTLSDLSNLQREAIIAKAISEGLDVIVRQGKANLAASNTKVRTGNLKGSFKKLTRKNQLKGYAGFSRPKGAVAHIIDRGTQMRSTKSGANRGKVTGNYFWTKAVESKKEEAQRELMNSIEKTIQTIINRNN